METRSDAVEAFRRLVSLLYREIGVLKTRNHPRVAAKAKLGAPFFQDRKGEAKRIYRETRDENQPHRILDSYTAQTGLTLEDIREAFEQGDWKTSSGSIAYGGLKWAKVAEFTQALCNSIDQDDEERLAALMTRLPTLQHNNGLIIKKFSQLD